MKLARPDDAQEGTRPPQEQVLGDIEVACQGKMLVDRPDATDLGCVRVVEPAVASVDADLASIGLKNSRQDAN
jgi:hypothetical protein